MSTNEELQSLNEELYTVNAELRQKIAEHTEISRDVEHLLESMEVGTLFLDADLRIRKFTALAVDLFSVEPQDVGRSVIDFRFSLTYPDLLDDLRVVLAGAEQRIDREVEGPNGRWYLLRIRPYTVGGDVHGVVLTVIDVAALKEAELRSREAVVRRDEFIAMLSHELRNPLAAIVSAIELTRIGDGKSAALDERVVDIISRQSMQMSRILEDLLDVSRITRDKLELHTSELDLYAPVRAAVEAQRSQAEQAGIALYLELEGDAVVVEGDAGRLQQVVSNLVGNAIKYNWPGGSVWVGCRREGDSAVLTVRDDGVGISDELREDLFEPFVQSVRGQSRSDGGMGVGLSLARSITELHGGEVTFCSDGPGQGSEFVVTIPVAGGAQRQRSGSLPTRRTVDRSFILLVEDEADNRELLTTLLEREGYAVKSAVDGASALEILDGARPRMALIDIGIPEPDGYELARMARESYPDIALVALTGYGARNDRAEAQESGFDEHLVKPVDFESLHAVVDRYMQPAEAAAVDE